MADFRIENRTLTDSPPAESAEPFVYQHIHVCDLRPVELASHLAVAAAEAREAFGTDFRPDPRETDSLCRQMLLRNRYPQELSACIVMRLGASGTVHYRCGGIFAHKGLAFNAVRPEATILCHDLPFGEGHTSVRLETHRTAMAVAHRRGFGSVVRCTAQGYAATLDDNPLFAVFGRRIVTPPAPPSVERDRVVRAAAAAGYALAEEPLTNEMLLRADEIFCSDCRGITALARCDSRTLGDIIAHRIAEIFEF